MHPILDSLKGTQFEWLRSLLFTFNTGDIDAFERIAVTPAFKGLVSSSNCVFNFSDRFLASLYLLHRIYSPEALSHDTR